MGGTNEQVYHEILIIQFVSKLIVITGRNEGNILFNNTLNTFYLWLYGVGHMVKDHSDSESKPAATTWATLFD